MRYIWAMQHWQTDIRAWESNGESTQDVGKLAVGVTTCWQNDWIPFPFICNPQSAMERLLCWSAIVNS